MSSSNGACVAPYERSRMEAPQAEQAERVPIAPVSFAELLKANPCLHPPVIDGLLRAGETMNVVSASKVGKSWLGYSMAMSVVTGGEWLGQFPCARGKVLLVDNELHACTIANRLPRVAMAMGLEPEDYENQIAVLSLRGRLQDLHGVIYHLEQIPAGEYQLVILDAWYRCLPAGMSENDNASIMGLYNRIDQIAQELDVAWVNIHHSSKGSQTEKSVTDVGSGAGSQSRAADCHCVLRAHEDEGVVVLEAAVRSFAPVAPLALRWEFPLWQPAADVDTNLLKGRKTKAEQRASDKDEAGVRDILDALVRAGGPMTARKLAPAAGMGRDRFDRLAAVMVRNEYLVAETTTQRGNETTSYYLPAEPGEEPEEGTCVPVLEHVTEQGNT